MCKDKLEKVDVIGILEQVVKEAAVVMAWDDAKHVGISQQLIYSDLFTRPILSVKDKVHEAARSIMGDEKSYSLDIIEIANEYLKLASEKLRDRLVSLMGGSKADLRYLNKGEIQSLFDTNIENAIASAKAKGEQDV